jgi:hypothetical protein
MVCHLMSLSTKGFGDRQPGNRVNIDTRPDREAIGKVLSISGSIKSE